jgi:hypothetical protein
LNKIRSAHCERRVIRYGVRVKLSRQWKLPLFPALLQAGQESGLDLGGDVAVDVFDLVGEGVAEASGLGDVGVWSAIIQVVTPLPHLILMVDGFNKTAGQNPEMVARVGLEPNDLTDYESVSSPGRSTPPGPLATLVRAHRTTEAQLGAS